MSSVRFAEKHVRESDLETGILTEVAEAEGSDSSQGREGVTAEDRGKQGHGSRFPPNVSSPNIVCV